MIVRDMGDTALLVQLGEAIDLAVHDRVVSLDRALATAAPAGLVEAVPSFGSLLVVFDPELTSRSAMIEAVRSASAQSTGADEAGRLHRIPVRYGGVDGPDLDAVAERLGLTPEQVAAEHRAAEYRVFMYGFAPGYAYLGGGSPALRLPRKPAAERGHPVGSVMIAAGQCLISTLPMPTGWWIIGRTEFRVLDAGASQPFRFSPGDRVLFELETA